MLNALKLLARAGSTACLLAWPAFATTHTVNVGPGFTFSPANLTAQVGDTVKWNWVSGLHDVVSGSGGIPNGIFDGGAATSVPGVHLTVVFDEAFLAANPVTNNKYDYFCVIHVGFGMVGSVKVQVPGLATPYGCLNPVGSLAVLAGTPKLGTTLTLGVTNPLGTQGVGSLAFLSVSALPMAGFPCGLPLPGFGMSGPGAPGEILLDVTPGVLVNPPFGPVLWTGAPAGFALPLPLDTALIGKHIYFEGAMLDLVGPVTLGLTNALDVRLGDA
jgi:plastocyanin